jgi:hypothetical protein
MDNLSKHVITCEGAGIEKEFAIHGPIEHVSNSKQVHIGDRLIKIGILLFRLLGSWFFLLAYFLLIVVILPFIAEGRLLSRCEDGVERKTRCGIFWNVLFSAIVTF